MKNFTKFLVTGVLLATGGSTFAQCDISCTSVNSPPAGITVYANQRTQLNYTRENVGATTISDTAQVTMEVSVNGTLVTTYFRTPAAWAPGATETINGSLDGIAWGTLGLSSGPISLCVATNVSCDNNPGNDEACISLTYDDGGFDHDLGIGAGSVKVTDPILPANNIMYSNKTYTMKTLTFDVENFGATQLPAGLTFSVFVTVKGTQYGPFTGWLGADLAPTGVTTFNIFDTDQQGIFFPSSSQTGPFDICVSIDPADPNDLDNTNNESCTGFEIIDVTGIEEVEEALSHVFFSNTAKQLNVNFSDAVKGNVELHITSLSGQTVKKMIVNANGQTQRIDLSDVNSGLYMVNMYMANGEVDSKKFVIN